MRTPTTIISAPRANRLWNASTRVKTSTVGSAASRAGASIPPTDTNAIPASKNASRRIGSAVSPSAGSKVLANPSPICRPDELTPGLDPGDHDARGEARHEPEQDLAGQDVEQRLHRHRRVQPDEGDRHQCRHPHAYLGRNLSLAGQRRGLQERRDAGEQREKDRVQMLPRQRRDHRSRLALRPWWRPRPPPISAIVWMTWVP